MPGVSEAAPYHHFASRAALVEALVRETLQQLAQALREATQATEGTPLDRLVAVGVAYVRFAFAVLLLTTYDDADLIMRGLQAGAQGYLLKDTSGSPPLLSRHAKCC